jgi:hypothetical protein
MTAQAAGVNAAILSVLKMVKAGHLADLKATRER